MQESNNFVNGLFVNERKNAPDFVNAKISIGPKFQQWYEANKNEKGYVNIDILTSREGKQYAKHNDFKPQSGMGGGSSYSAPAQNFSQVPTEIEDDLPF